MKNKKSKILKTPDTKKEGKLVWTEYKKTNPYKIHTYADPIPNEEGPNPEK